MLARPTALKTFWCECIWKSKLYIKVMLKKKTKHFKNNLEEAIYTTFMIKASKFGSPMNCHFSNRYYFASWAPYVDSLGILLVLLMPYLKKLFKNKQESLKISKINAYISFPSLTERSIYIWPTMWACYQDKDFKQWKAVTFLCSVASTLSGYIWQTGKFNLLFSTENMTERALE